MKKYSKKIKEALNKINFSEVLRAYDYGEFVEVLVNRWGDICTYRIYNNGEIVEK